MDIGKYNKEKVFRYSIRKYHFGAASVAVAALMFFANGAVAAHEPITPATTNEVATMGSDGKADGDLGSSDEGDSDKVLTDQPAELKAADEVKTQEAPAEETNQGQAGAESNSAQSETNPANQEPSQAGEVKEQEEPTVADTTAAKSTQGNLQALLANLTLDSMKALHDEVEAGLAAANAVLSDPKATQAQVDEQTRAMEALISRVNQALTPSLETPTILEKAGLASTGLTPTGLATPDGAAATQASGGKSRRRVLSEPTSDENQGTPSAGGNTTAAGTNSQMTPQALPTYTNTEGKNGVYDLKDELEFITDQLRANGASADKIQAAKAAVDKFNEAFSKGDTISQEDFSAALADLKKSRELIEGVLSEKEANGAVVSSPLEPRALNGGSSDYEAIPTEDESARADNVTIQPRTNATGWSGFRSMPAGAQTRTRRAPGQDRAIATRSGIESADYDTKTGYLFESGQNGSPYPKYSYVFYSKGGVGNTYYEGGKISEAYQGFHINVRPTKTGLYWQITVNENHKTLGVNKVYFTLPQGQVLKSGSVSVQTFNKNGGTLLERPTVASGEDELKNALSNAFRNLPQDSPFRGAELKDVEKGTKDKTNARISNIGTTQAQRFKVGTLEDIAREQTYGAGYLNRGFYNRRDIEPSNLQKYSDAKFNTIQNDVRDVYTFSLNSGDDHSYKITFETSGSNDLGKLTYAGGLKRVENATRQLINQWYARTPEERDDTDKFKFKISGNGYFKVNQNTAYVNFATSYPDGTQVKAEGANKALNYPRYIDDPLNTGTKGVLTYSGDLTVNGAFNIDFTSYGEYSDENDQPIEKQKGKQEANQRNQSFRVTDEDTNKVYDLTTDAGKKQMTMDIISKPGVHNFRYVRRFPTDNSSDDGKLSFVTKPKTPTLEALTNKAEITTSVTASGGTQGYNMVLYRKLDNGNLEKVKMLENGVEKDAIVKANAKGQATFTGVELAQGKYVVKTVIDQDWIDYDGSKQQTVESDNSTEMTATVGQKFATKPVITQDVTDLSLAVKIGQDNATKAVVRYTDTNSKEQNVTFIKGTDGNWSKETATANSGISIQSSSNGTAVVTLPNGTAKPASTVYAKQKVENKAYSEEASKEVSQLRIGLANAFGTDIKEGIKFKTLIPDFRTTGNTLKFLAKGNTKIKAIEVTGGENLGISWVKNGLGTTTAYIAANNPSGFSRDKGGVHSLTVKVTPDTGKPETFETSVIIPPKAGTFETTNEQLKEKASEKPTIKVKDLNTNLGFGNITSPELEWKAYLVKGGRDADPDYQNYYFKSATDYTVLASSSITADGKATFDAASYRQTNVGTDPLKVVTALVHKGTDTVFDGVVSPLSTSTVQATSQKQPFATKPVLATTTNGDITAKIGENSATIAVLSYEVARGTNSVIFQKQNGTWIKNDFGAAPTVTVTTATDGTAMVTVPFGTARSGTQLSAQQRSNDTDPSEAAKITVPTDTTVPEVKIGTGDNAQTLPQSRTDSNTRDAVYEVVQGQAFRPELKAWDNFEKLTKFRIDNLRPGITATNANDAFNTTTKYSQQAPFSPTFTGNIPENTAPGVYTSTITVSDGTTGDKNYYFKYKVLPTAPTVTPTTQTGNQVLSNDRTLKGTATAGAKIKVTVAGQTVAENIQVGSDGHWTVNLREGLNSNHANHANQTQLVAKDPVAVTQTVNGVESPSTNVTVAVGSTTIEPSETGGTSLYAGAKEVVVKTPHDAGMFYLRYTDKDTGATKDLGFKRTSIDGPWTSVDSTQAVVKGTPTKDGFTETVTIAMKKPIKVGTASTKTNISEGNYGTPADWQAISVTNEAPTLAGPQGNTTTIEKGGQLNLDTLVTAHDKEDDQNATLGNGVTKEIVSVNGVAATKTVDVNRPGSYVVKYKATDSQGVSSSELDVTVKVKPTAPTVTAGDNGDVTVRPAMQDNVNTVSFTYTNANTTSPTNKTVTANKTNNSWSLTGAPTDGVTIDATTGVVTIKDREIKDNSQVTAKSVTTDNVESTTVTANSKVGDRIAPTFTFSDKYTEVVNGERVVYVTPTEDLADGSITLGTVEDNSGKLSEVVLFQGDSQSTNMQYELQYNIKSKTNNGDFAAPYDIQITGKLPKLNPDTRRAWDPNLNNGNIVTRYVSATDAAGNQLKSIRNVATEPTRVVIRLLTQKDKYTPQISTQILNKDITASNATVTADEFNKIKEQIDFSAKKGDVKVNRNSTDLTIERKDNGAIKRKADTDTYYVEATVTYPDGTREDFEIPLDQGDKVAPKVKVNGVELKDNVTENPTFVVFRGATFNPTFEVNDNSGTTTYLKASDLPTGREFVKDESMSNGTNAQLNSDNTVPSTAVLGEHEAKVLVKDASNNQKEYKFKYIVADVELKTSEKTVEFNSTLGDAHEFVKAVVASNSDGDDKYYPRSMTFKWSKDSSDVANDTQLTTPGTVTYKAVADFYNQGGKYTKDIAGIGNGVTIYAPDKIEKPVTFKVKPTAPTVRPQDNGTVLITHDNQPNVNRISVTYTTQGDNPREVTYTATKNGDSWSFGSGAPLTVNPTTGEIKLKDGYVKEGSTVKVKALTTPTTGNVESTETTETVRNRDHQFPTVTFQNVETDADGNRVVYITPTEEANLPIATFNDNSGKLVAANFVGYDGSPTNLSSVNLEFSNRFAKDSAETQHDAPITLNVTGKLSKTNPADRNNLWTDGGTIGTIYADAEDVAGNRLHESPGAKDNTKNSPTRVILKARTQATKYIPTITTQPLEKYITSTTTVTGDEFNAMKENLTFTSTKGNVNVTNKTSDLTVAMKDGGLIKSKEDGSHYVGATVTYPDGTREDFEIPVKSIKPAVPTVTPETNGDVTATPVDEPNVDKLEVTYTPADINQLQDNGDVTKTPQAETKVVATKDANNQWSITEGAKDGISIDPNTGKITLKDQVVKGQSNVVAKVVAQNVLSDSASQTAANGDTTLPVIGASSKLVEAGKEVNIPLELSDDGVGIDESNIKVTNLPEGLSYDAVSNSIKGTLKDVSKSDIKVAVLDKNGNKAEKTISLVAVKPKTVYAISGGTIENVDDAANFVEVPQGVTLTSATWKDDSKPTTEEVGRTTRTITANLDGYDNLELTTPVFVYPAVTLRKVNNQEVTTYHEVVGQPLTSAVWWTGGRTQPAKPDFYVTFEGDKPAGTTIEFEGGMPTNTTAGLITKKIIVTYPNGAGKFERELTFRTYGYEANYPTGKDYFETEVGKPFTNVGAGSYVKPSSNLTTPSRTYIGWGDGFGSSPVQRAQTTIGVREEQVNVHYGTKVESERGDETHRYTDQNIKVTLAVKPKAPTLQGQAGTKPAVTVSNLPETSQLATGSTVKVQLKDAQGTVVAEKEITAGTTTVTFVAADYKKDLALGEQLNANVLVAGTYKKTIRKNTTEDTAYEVSSAKSDSVTVKTYADFYRDQVTYPTNAEKVTYGNSDIANGNFTDAAKERFAAKIQEVNANNSNLPANVTYTKGTTDDKAKVATINFPEDGSTIDISHTQVAKPEVPTFNATVGSGEDAKLSDVDRTISGTALESDTKVVLTLQTGKTVEIDANNGKDPANLKAGEGALKNGVWTYKLENNMYLRQTDQTAEIGSSDQPVKVKQTVFTAESDESTIYVAKERNFAGKTITAAQGSQTLTDLKADARKGIKYTEKDVEKAFPGDFTATWKEQPDVETVGTRTYKVQLTETSATGTNKVGEYDVTITVTNPAPAELTYENKQNGETRIKLPDDADKVAFTIPGDNQLNTVTVTHSERDGWTVPANSVFTKDGDYLVVNSKDVGGNRNITAVATKGDGNLKSTETPTSIAVPTHEVGTTKISKVVGGDTPTNEELLNAVTVDHKASATLKDGTTYPTALGTHTIEVVVTYADNTTEIVEVPYEVKSADKSQLQTSKDALETSIGDVPATAGKTEASKKAYEDAKADAETALAKAKEVLADTSATEAQVKDAKDKADAAKQKLDTAKAGLADVDKSQLQTSKDALETSIGDVPATAGKTEASKKAYEDAKADAETALAKAKEVLADTSATEAQVKDAKDKADAAKQKLDTAKAGLVDKPTSVPSNDGNTNNGANTDNSSNSNTSGDTNNSADTNNGGTTTPAPNNSNSVIPDNSANTPAPGVTTDDSSNTTPVTPSSTVGQAQASTPAQETPVSTNTPNNSGDTATPSETRPVDKSELARLVEELETRLKDLDGIDQSVIDAAKVILGEGQEALRNADLTEAGLKEMTAKVKEALESLKGKQATKDEEERKETSKEQGHLPYGTMIGSLLALLGLLLFLIARHKKESELKKLTKELTKVLQESDLTNVDAKVLDQAREALAQAVAFLANEKESDHTEDELIEKLKAILAQLR
ncbi:YSIRK-type signal peptide-containing protein [Streptococcus sp. 1453]|uniref:YSIRK-type signal peptide-containing protein n=1 Tax=Streptococcus sp. 1453 TaxID=2582661 RepID=UPI001F04CF30|nr:YSIRK-type signal peptide-containing protein [Streptococcus sp. 1453]